MHSHTWNLIVGLSLAAALLAHAEHEPNFLEKEALPSRTHETREGTFVFGEEQTLLIEGQNPLRVLVYRHLDKDANLIEFAIDVEGSLLVLREAETDANAAPSLEGVDVLPGINKRAAEIVVRWRHPGEDVLRSVEKYRYDVAGLELVAKSHLVREGEEKKWVNAKTDESPASARPESESP